MVDDADEVCARVGRRIGELREKAQVTQRTIAEAAGMEVANYQRVENGQENLTLRLLVKIASAFDVPVITLFKPAKTAAVKRTRGRPKKRTASAKRSEL